MCCGPLSSSVPSYSDDIHTAKQKPHPLVVRTVCFWARIAYVPGTIHIYPVSNLRGEPRCQVLRYQAGCKRLKSQSSCIVIAATSLLVVEPVGAKASKQPTPCTRLHSLLLYPMTTVRTILPYEALSLMPCESCFHLNSSFYFTTLLQYVPAGTWEISSKMALASSSTQL